MTLTTFRINTYKRIGEGASEIAEDLGNADYDAGEWRRHQSWPEGGRV
jgi:hypothetical protein